MKRSSLVIGALILLTVATMRTDAVERLRVDVSPMRSLAPSTLTIRVTIPPIPENRQLEIVADSGGFYRSSFVPLEGKEGPSTVSLQFRNVPSGDYTVTAFVRNGRGQQLAQADREVSVLALGAEP